MRKFIVALAAAGAITCAAQTVENIDSVVEVTAADSLLQVVD